MQTALAFALSYAQSVHRIKIVSSLITILADRDYYSHDESSTKETTSTLEHFVGFRLPLTEAHKTGLGSSAALVTALTAAVLTYYLPPNIIDLERSQGQQRLHNLAQASHCTAQGKIGSGFDVAAAVYGSCVYRRFSPQILEGLGDIGKDGFSENLRMIVDDIHPESKWDTNVDKTAARIPQGLALVMCDVDCGSETVGLVKSVLRWRKESPEESKLLWATLQAANEDLANQLGYLPSKELCSPRELDAIRDTILTMRSLVREMSTKAGVPIEPPVQTALIDACCELPGVLGGMVPGAGGYDAIALLVEERKETFDDLDVLLNSYQTDVKSNEGVGIGKVRLLGVKQEYSGVRSEDPVKFEKWIN